MKALTAIVSSLAALAFATVPAVAGNFGLALPTARATFCADSENAFLENGGFSRFTRGVWSGGLGDDNLNGAPGFRIDANKAFVRTFRMIVEEQDGASGVTVAYSFRVRRSTITRVDTRGIEFKKVNKGTLVVFKLANSAIPNNADIEYIYVYATGSGAYQTNISAIQVNNSQVFDLAGLQRECTAF